MKKTTWQGKLFIASWVVIAIAAILYAVSENTVSTHLGRVQEAWSIVIFVLGVAGLLGSLLGASGE